MIGNKDAIKPLIAALADFDTQVRVAAARALGQLGQTEWLTWVKGDSGDWERLASGQHPDSKRLLRVAAGNARTPQSAEAVLSAIAEPDRIDALAEMLRDRAFKYPVECVEVLHQTGDHRATPILCQALSHSDIAVQVAAAHALGQIKDPEAIDSLYRAMRRDDSAVCNTSAAALGELADPRAVDTLLALAKSGPENAASAAIAVLKRMPGEQARRGLGSLVRDLIVLTFPISEYAGRLLEIARRTGALRPDGPVPVNIKHMHEHSKAKCASCGTLFSEDMLSNLYISRAMGNSSKVFVGASQENRFASSASCPKCGYKAMTMTISPQ